MLELLFRITIAVDRALASRDEKVRAGERARYARAVYGRGAYDATLRKLRVPQRRKSRRTLRLTVAELLYPAARGRDCCARTV